MKIDWKSDEKNLTKLYPRETDQEDDDMEDLPSEPGSFFNFFEHEADPYDVSTARIIASSSLLTPLIDRTFHRR